jgi:hypothetical protein
MLKASEYISVLAVLESLNGVAIRTENLECLWILSDTVQNSCPRVSPILRTVPIDVIELEDSMVIKTTADTFPSKSLD